MVFNSLHFVGFFLVVYGLYRILPHRAQNWLLLAASYYFYAAWDWRFLGLLVASTVVDFCCALYIAGRSTSRQRKTGLVVSIAFNLSMLGFFRYFNFFADNFHALFGLLGWRVDFFTLRVLLPIGISFYTFITMSYVIDVYRRHIEPTRNLLHFAVFVAYFPHLVAGPILRASLLLPQIAHRRTISREQMVEGAWLSAWGLFKKIFVADNLARVADAVFAPAGPFSPRRRAPRPACRRACGLRPSVPRKPDGPVRARVRRTPTRPCSWRAGGRARISFCLFWLVLRS